MSEAATITIKVAGAGDFTFSWSSATLSNAASPLRQDAVALSTGANTLTPPTGCAFALLVPPTTSAIAKTLKGITGDTGVPLAPAQPTMLSLATAAAFVITASAGETIKVIWI